MDRIHPFAPAHSRESFYETPALREALDRLTTGMGAREPFLLVTGAPGTGKTMLVHEAIARLGDRVVAAFPTRSAIEAGELIEDLVRRFGAEPPDAASRSKLVACLEQVLAGLASRKQTALVVVDDAHDLTVPQLEELRLLADTALRARASLEVLIAGLPTLDATLADPALAALHQRASVRVRLEPLAASDTRH